MLERREGLAANDAPWRHACLAVRLGGGVDGGSTQGWRHSSQTDTVGGGKLGSAKVPMAMAMSPGNPSPVQQTVDPHTGQKRKVSALPLSDERVHSVAIPAMATWSRWKRAWLLITAPVRRWHSKQWHIEMRTGSPSTMRLSWPQLQAARRVVKSWFRSRLMGAQL